MRIFIVCLGVVFTLLISGCKTGMSDNIIEEDVLSTIVENTLEYQDTSLGLEAIFYKSERYKCIPSSMLNKKVAERFKSSKALKISESKDTAYFYKYLANELSKHYDSDLKKVDEQFIYSSDLYCKGDTILFLIARPHSGATCFYVHKKDLNIIKSEVLLFF